MCAEFYHLPTTPMGILAVAENIWLSQLGERACYHNLRGQGPCLNILQCTGQLPSERMIWLKVSVTLLSVMRGWELYRFPYFAGVRIFVFQWTPVHCNQIATQSVLASDVRCLPCLFGTQCVQNSARYLCGLCSPIEKGEMVRLFLVVKKNWRNTSECGEEKRVCWNRGNLRWAKAWIWWAKAKAQAANLKSVKPKWGR